MNTKIPKHFQAILWSHDIKNLDLEEDKHYIIHQVLMYGTLEDIEWLKKVYSKKEIERVFVESPKKIYTASALNFVKSFILNITERIDESKYLKFTPRRIG